MRIIDFLYVIFHWKFDQFQMDLNVGTTTLRITSIWKPVIYFVILLEF